MGAETALIDEEITAQTQVAAPPVAVGVDLTPMHEFIAAGWRVDDWVGLSVGDADTCDGMSLVPTDSASLLATNISEILCHHGRGAVMPIGEAILRGVPLARLFARVYVEAVKSIADPAYVIKAVDMDHQLLTADKWELTDGSRVVWSDTAAARGVVPLWHPASSLAFGDLTFIDANGIEYTYVNALFDQVDIAIIFALVHNSYYLHTR